MAGVAGLEPTNTGVKVPCLNRLATPLCEGRFLQRPRGRRIWSTGLLMAADYPEQRQAFGGEHRTRTCKGCPAGLANPCLTIRLIRHVAGSKTSGGAGTTLSKLPDVFCSVGATVGTRTQDLSITRRLLCQLSYGGVSPWNRSSTGGLGAPQASRAQSLGAGGRTRTLTPCDHGFLDR